MSVPGDRFALVTLARSGDRRSLDELLSVCRPDLERYARRACQSEDIDEAVQDALWILSRRIGALRSVTAFAGWLFQIVRRACLRYAGRRRRTIPLDGLPASAERDRSVPDPELRAIVADALARLPKTYRDVLILRDVQGYTSEEVAGELEITTDAAKSRLHRARWLVRGALAGSPSNSDRKAGKASRP